MIEIRGFAVIMKSSDTVIKAAKMEMTSYEESGCIYAMNLVREML